MRGTQVVALGACAAASWLGLGGVAAAEEPVEEQVAQSAPAPAPVEDEVAQSAPAPTAVEEQVAQSAPAPADESVQSAPAPAPGAEQSAAAPQQVAAAPASGVDARIAGQAAIAPVAVGAALIEQTDAPIPVDPPAGSSVPTGTLDDGSTVAQAGPPVPSAIVTTGGEAAAVALRTTPVAAPVTTDLPETGQRTAMAIVASVLCGVGVTLVTSSRRRSA